FGEQRADQRQFGGGRIRYHLGVTELDQRGDEFHHLVRTRKGVDVKLGAVMGDGQAGVLVNERRRLELRDVEAGGAYERVEGLCRRCIHRGVVGRTRAGEPAAEVVDGEALCQRRELVEVDA